MQWQPLVLPWYRGDSRAVFVVGPDAQRFVRSSKFPDDLQFIRVKMQIMV
jgi:hypothetical protein